MILAIDVYYRSDDSALAAGVTFRTFDDAVPEGEYVTTVDQVEDYVPGEFYRRELPCILKLMEEIEEPIETVVLDSYVMLGDKPGLGMYLYNALEGKIPVIGVAKKRFEGAEPIEIYRGESDRPLCITTAGIDAERAAEQIKGMKGEFRIPELLKRVDSLSRHGLEEEA